MPSLSTLIPPSDPIPELLKFIQHWVTDLTDEHRMDPAEIPASVPPPLQAIYELTGNYAGSFAGWNGNLFGHQDLLRSPDELVLREDRINFLFENQGRWQCETLAGHPDPPVYSDRDADGDGFTFVEVCPRLSVFLTTYCLQELCFGSPHMIHPAGDPRYPCELVNGVVTHLWEDDGFFHGGSTDSFFLSGDEALIMGTETFFFIGCRTENGRRFLRKEVWDGR